MPKAPLSKLPATDCAALTRSSRTLEKIWSGFVGRRPLFCKRFSASCRYCSTVLAIIGTAPMRATNCSTTSGTR
jgi:hypothetical protein